jgi:hypothetical protein
VAPGAPQVQPIQVKKVVELLSNLGSAVTFGKRVGVKTGQITVIFTAISAFSAE